MRELNKLEYKGSKQPTNEKISQTNVMKLNVPHKSTTNF